MPGGTMRRGRYHDPSGAVLGGGDRHAMSFELAGRRWDIPVEREASYDFILPADARWDDGRPVSGAERDLAAACIERYCALEGIAFTVFRPMPPGREA